MKFSAFLLIAAQASIALSQQPVGRPEPNDGRGTISADDLAKEAPSQSRLFRRQEPADSSEPNDGRGTISADDLVKSKRSIPPTGDELFKRACWYRDAEGDSYGCSKGGFCFMKCGQYGQWCWVAANNKDGLGRGPWLTCSAKKECNPRIWSGKANCGAGGCKECGCSC